MNAKINAAFKKADSVFREVGGGKKSNPRYWVVMTSARALEILNIAIFETPFSQDTRPHMSHDEIADVSRLWETMPGSTSFNDALRRIVKGKRCLVDCFDCGAVPEK